MLRERIHGPIGHAVDTFALCGTVFGLTTTLGYGVLQISAGLHDMTGWQTDSKIFQVGLIVVVMTMAGASAASGLGKGLRRLSELNLALAVLLMLFVLAVGPTLYLLGAFSDNVGNYLSSVVSMTFETYTYDTLKDPAWFDNWTLLYWAWWISWSPFVGMFIARISRGRTIREFIIGVLVVPTLFNFLWMTVFGNSAMWLDMHGTIGELSAAATNVDALLFNFLGRLPWPEVTTGLAVLLILVFFVTSADSGTFVIDAIASGGQDGSPIWQRLFWAVLLAITAALLLVTGGLEALRAMTIISALPFTVVMLALCYGLWRGLKADRTHFSEDLAPATSFWTGQHWRKRLELILRQPTGRDVARFLNDTAMPALTEVAQALRAQGVEGDVSRNEEDGSVVLNVPRGNLRNFVYGVRPVRVELPAYIISEAALPAQKRTHSYQPVTFFEDGRLGYNVEYLSQQELIADVLKQYERYLTLVQDARTHLLNAAPGHSA
jgi:choline/glycine/proline betaine transport protein